MAPYSVDEDTLMVCVTLPLCVCLYVCPYYARVGSGGNHHAVDHYEAFRYPLAVKLGTITPDGADVYSYEEDEMVEVPKLAEYLAHFGINRMQLSKVRCLVTHSE